MYFSAVERAYEYFYSNNNNDDNGYDNDSNEEIDKGDVEEYAMFPCV